MSAPNEDAPDLIGRRIVDAGLATPLQIEEALRAQRSLRGSLGYHLLRLGRITPSALGDFLEGELAAGRIEGPRAPTSEPGLEALPARLAHLYNAYPLGVRQGRLELGVPPLHGDAVHAVGEATGLIVEPTVLPARALREAVERDYLGGAAESVVRPVAGLALFLVDDGVTVRPLAPSLRTPALSAEVALRSLLGEAISTRTRVVDIARGRGPCASLGDAADDVVKLVEDLARLPPRSASRVTGRFQVELRGRRPVAIVVRDGWQEARLQVALADQRFPSLDVDDVCDGHPELQDAVESFANGGGGVLLACGPSGGGLRRLVDLLGTRLAEVLHDARRISSSPPAGAAFASIAARGDAETAHAIQEATSSGAGLVVVEELPGTRSMERALMSGARTPVLAGLVAEDPVAGLGWLARHGFSGALKAGLVHGIIGIVSVDEACPSCTAPARLPQPLADRWALPGGGGPLVASAGCDTCLVASPRRTIPVLAWMPIAGAPAAALAVDDLAQARSELREAGAPMLLDRVLDRCRSGAGGELASAVALLGRAC